MVFLRQCKEEEKFPCDDDRFPLPLESFFSCTGNAQYEFCLVVIRDIEPFLTLFQSEKPLVPFLFEKLKGLIVLILQRFVKSKCHKRDLHKYIQAHKFEVGRKQSASFS